MLKQIGKFTLIERIGRGSYSHVYRAEDAQGRSFAIKISTTPSNPEHLAEFQKDLVAAASVLHPNLVSVLDMGFDGEFPYILMELAEGRDLSQIVPKHASLPLGERVNVMQQVAGALKSAHERGVFHLDIRPTKIMMADNGGAKLLDLGLGRLSYDPERVTEHGYLVGSPFYMSPERLTDTETANAQCDIWSFGVTLYELIAGQHPFHDEDGEEMISRIMFEQPASLPDAPSTLNELVLRTLEKDPRKRYQSFAELLADLKPITGGLHREKSDALFAEALKQSNRGSWQEARRIARQVSELEPEKAPGAQFFGFSNKEPVTEQEYAAEPEPVAPAAPFVAAAAPPPAAATPVAGAAVAITAAAASSAIAGSGIALDTPEPAPPRVPQPQRPERTAPRIPNIGGHPPKNGGGTAKGDNGFSQPGIGGAVAPANGKHHSEVIAAPAPPPVEGLRPGLAESRRYVEPPSFSTGGRTSTVRVLEEPEGGGWRKIAVAIALVLLIAGALFYFLGPYANLGKQPGTAEAKTVSPSGRVIKPGEASDDRIQIPGVTGEGTSGKSEVSVTMPPADLGELAPRLFDPRSLTVAKLPPASSSGDLARLKPPALRANAPLPEYSGLPFLPPPPAYVAPVAKAVPPPEPVNSTLAKTNSIPLADGPAPARNVRRGGLYNQPVLIHKVDPVFPAAVTERKADGSVSFQATIAKDGSVKELKLISGDPLLNMAAEQAVAQWKFRPATLNGDPVEVTQTIVVKYRFNP